MPGDNAIPAVFVQAGVAAAAAGDDSDDGKDVGQ